MSRNSLLTIAMGILALPLGGCEGAYVGNVAMVVVAGGLFLGTVQLRRPTSNANPNGSPSSATNAAPTATHSKH